MSETRGSARGKSAETLNSILNFLSDFEKEENVDLSSHNNNHHHNNTHNSTHNNTHNNNNNNDRDGSKLLLPPARTGERAEHASGTSVLTELLQFSLETGSEPSTRRRQGTNAKSTELAAAAPATETAPGSDVVASARVEYDGAATTRGHSAADSTISLISRRMKTARVQLAEKQAEIDVLRGQVAERDRRIAELDGSASKEAIALKAENERTIARHLETISKLVSDKGKLTQKIASLLRGFERVEAEYQEKIKHMKARYDADFDGKREVLRQQEKQRRLKWEKAKVEEIREITVQGLQPEIQRLLEVHKANLRKKDQDAEDRLATLRRQLMQEHQLEVQALQNRFRGEVESAAHEQRQSMQRAMESQQLKFEDLKQNLIKEKHVELSTLKAQHATEAEALEAAHRKAMDAQRKEYEAEKALLRNQAGSEALELKRRQDTRVSQTLREMEIERDAWRKKIVDKLRRESENAMDELRSHLQKKHRRQLENVDQSWQVRMAEMRQDLERHLQDELSADAQLKAQSIADLRDRLARCQGRVEELSQQLEEARQSVKSLRRDRDTLREDLRRVDSTAMELRGERDSLKNDADGVKWDIVFWMESLPLVARGSYARFALARVCACSWWWLFIPRTSPRV
eukprot:INCI17666.8.p1 GENE.INCI17666.8~~INCI17666.8.p1  ORF type:complete len:634 (-),score=156.41 INCI17666.8:953-2854(-)